MPFDRPEDVTIADVVFVEGDVDKDGLTRLHAFLVDPLLQQGSWGDPETPGTEITYLPGVTDSAARRCSTPPRSSGSRSPARPPGGGSSSVTPSTPSTSSGSSAGSSPTRSSNAGSAGASSRRSTPPAPSTGTVDKIPLAGRGLDELLEIGRDRALALDPEELRRHPRPTSTALGRDPTDVELETLAQTWSEHCAHKTFRAAITADDGEDRSAAARACCAHAPTRSPPRSCESAFVGNAGIVVVRARHDARAQGRDAQPPVGDRAVRRRQHRRRRRDPRRARRRPTARSPSPTSCASARPTCRSTDAARRRRCTRAASATGVVAGVADYGNKIGLPTVAGAVLYDPGYTTNPLVFCGCIGIADDRPLPDAARTPATASSCSAGAPVATASAAPRSPVADDGRHHRRGRRRQRADRRPDHREAADRRARRRRATCTRRSPTAAPAGCRRRSARWPRASAPTSTLDRVPLKYPGPRAVGDLALARPRSAWSSPSPPAPVARAASDGAQRHGVELADARRVHRRRRARSCARRRRRCSSSTPTFLHDGRPQRHDGRRACPRPTGRRPSRRDRRRSRATRCSRCSRTATSPPRRRSIHRYDHEIVRRHRRAPAASASAATDRPTASCSPTRPTRTASRSASASTRGTACTTPSAMAHAVVDEAIRNVVAVGADPDRVALLDNFSWGDPRRPSTLGELVAAVDGCCAAAIALRAPFVSRQGLAEQRVHSAPTAQRHAVPPTLVITAVAHVPDADRCVTPDARRAPATCWCCSARTQPRVRRQPPRPRARRAGRRRRASRRPTPTRPARYRRLHQAIRDGPRAVVPRRQRGRPRRRRSPRCASPAGSAPTIDRPRRTTTLADGAVRRVDRPVRRRGRRRTTSTRFAEHAATSRVARARHGRRPTELRLPGVDPIADRRPRRRVQPDLVADASDVGARRR